MKKIILLALVGLLFFCSREPETIEEYIKAGEKSFVDEEYQQARRYFSQALARTPSDRNLLYLMGVAYYRELMNDSAIVYLKRADLLFPNDREINLALYEASISSDDYKNARDALKVLVKTGDPIDSHLDELASLSISLKDFPYAYHYYRQLLKREPENPNRYLQVANTAAEIGSLDISMAVIDSAIEEFGQIEQFMANKGLYHAVRKDYITSEEIFRSLIAKDSTALTYRLNLANVLNSQNSTKKKREALQIYINFRDETGSEQWLDSLISSLEKKLNLGKQQQ
ncbi:MAG: hypothetical protein U9R56_01410 [candidate division Zixibacteria bacterium]|nr:hypothetical protein [candidate division Zixibacteria bacterium]